MGTLVQEAQAVTMIQAKLACCWVQIRLTLLVAQRRRNVTKLLHCVSLATRKGHLTIALSLPQRHVKPPVVLQMIRCVEGSLTLAQGIRTGIPRSMPTPRAQPLLLHVAPQRRLAPPTLLAQATN